MVDVITAVCESVICETLLCVSSYWTRAGAMKFASNTIKQLVGTFLLGTSATLLVTASAHAADDVVKSAEAAESPSSAATPAP
jgi:hypothetical protein